MGIKLSVQLRNKKEKLSPDFISGVLYGKGVTNQSLKFKRSEFEKVFSLAGESNLVDLDLDTQVTKVLIKEVQHDVMKHAFTHADFFKVDMKEKITTEIPLHFVGESKVIKELGGALIKDMSSLEVECLPGDLVDHIDVDISVMQSFDDAIRVSDIKLPAGLTLVHHTNDVVAAVKEPRHQEEVAAPVVEAAPVAGAKDAKDSKEVKPEAKK
jgi:large subunit ribosomal protein L25